MKAITKVTNVNLLVNHFLKLGIYRSILIQVTEIKLLNVELFAVFKFDQNTLLDLLIFTEHIFTYSHHLSTKNFL